MGWRKLGDDGQELCSLLDYLVDGVETLKTAVQMGRRLDGEGNMKVNVNELWCRGLYRDRAGNSTRPTLEDAKIVLRQMKDARSLLFSISNSLDNAVECVSEAVTNNCRSTGLSLLPDNVLASIFEIYVEISLKEVMDGEFTLSDISPHVLASVCRRFRQIVLARSSLWKQVSLRFPKMWLLSLKDRCQNPIVHVDAVNEIARTRMENFAFIHPAQQWREFHLEYVNEKVGHLYFEHLKSVIRSPLESLRHLSITSYNHSDEDGHYEPFSIYLDVDDSRTLSSWRMPNLTHLELCNVIPMLPLQLDNVTSFSLDLIDFCDPPLNMTAFRRLLQSMPKLNSLGIRLEEMRVTFDNRADTRLALPSLRSLELQTDVRTPRLTISQIMGLLNSEELTHLTLKVFGAEFEEDGEDGNLEGYISSLVFQDYEPYRKARSVPFKNIMDFTMEVRYLRCTRRSFEQLFRAMPNVQNVSMMLPQQEDLHIFPYNPRARLQQLRTLRLKLLQSCPDDFEDQIPDIEIFFGDGYCKDLEVFEVQFRRFYEAESSKADLYELFGEKLRWIEF